MHSEYELLAQVGAGADGVAYRARRSDGSLAEVRVLAAARNDAVRWERLTRRLQLARLVDHPAARRLRLDLQAVPPRVVLDWLDAPSFTQFFAGRLPLPAFDAAAMMLPVVAVLRAAHRVGIAHGALSPDTVHDGPRLDFTGTDTGTGTPAGTIGEPLDRDVFGVGQLLTWLLTGEHYESGSGVSDAAPASLRSLLLDTLTRQPEDRPGITEVEERLREALRLLHQEAGLAATNPAATAAEAPASPRRERLGRFQLVERLGQGGMGEVFRALDEATGNTVAIKVLLPEWSRRPEMLKRFQKEARLLRELNNPYVTNLLEVNEDEGTHYLALEFAAGKSVADQLQGGKCLEESFALGIIADVSRALTEAHARGIIHRDIKPDNILLLRDNPALSKTLAPLSEPLAKLSDFGLARHVVESESLHLTRTGAVVGTPLYLSPEQCTGAALDARSDIYSLGATLFHLLAGRPPFLGDSPLALLNQHCNTAPPPLRSLNPAISESAERLVAKMLAKSPAHRHPDAGELLGELERVLRGEPTAAAVHPRLPECDPRRVLEYDFTWELEATPEQLWPHVSNTERLNRAIQLPAVLFTTAPDATGRVRRHGKIRKMGIEAKWEEHPFEWIEGRRFGVLRSCEGGPFRWLVSIVELTPRSPSGTTLTHRFRIEPRGFLGRTFAAVEVGVRTRRSLDRVYHRIDAVVRSGGVADPFEEPAALNRAQQQRLDTALNRLARRGVEVEVVERFGAWLATAPAQEVARIRPLAVARRLGLDTEAVVAACLHGAREELLLLSWDLVCPLCRIPSEIKDTLKALREHGRCEACNADYDLDFARSVELIFRVHPSIREAETGTFCIGGPAHSPHVVAQVRLAAAERLELNLALAAGMYRLRGPQLPGAMEVRVDAEARSSRLEVSADRLTGSPLALLRPGGQVLVLHNPHEQELVLRLERMADRTDALTAARAAALGLFRQLFPGEVLSPGQLVGVAAVTLLATDVSEAKELAFRGEEGAAFARVHEHLLQLETVARQHGGALVKAIGDGGLAAFPEPVAAVRAMLALGDGSIVLHRGPAHAATINEHLDYFGQVVRQTHAMLSTALAGERLLSQAVMDDPEVVRLLREHGMQGVIRRADASAGMVWHEISRDRESSL